MISASGFPAYQMVFGSNPTDLFGWEVTESNLMFAQDTSLAGQFAQQRKLRMRARGAALKQVGNGKLRRLLQKKTFNCADTNPGGSALFYKAQDRESLPQWRGPANILNIDDAGVTATLQNQAFKVARYCVRKHMKAIDVRDKGWRNSLHRGDPWVGQRPDEVEVAQASDEVMRKSPNEVDVEQGSLLA